MTGFFKWAVEYTLKIEGGFVNDPDDAGKATKFGITMATLSHRRGHPVTVADVEALTIGEAISIYETNFWIPTGLAAVSKRPATAIAVFDAGVLFGPGVAMISAQRALNDCGCAVRVDGFAGPKTTDAMNAVKPAAFITAFAVELSERIESIILRNPSDAKYRKGWLTRVHKYQSLV